MPTRIFWWPGIVRTIKHSLKIIYEFSMSERLNKSLLSVVLVWVFAIGGKLSTQGLLWMLGTRENLKRVLKMLFVNFVISRILTQKLVNCWKIEERTGLFTNSAPQLCRPSTHSLPSSLLSISALLFTSLSESRSACLLALDFISLSMLYTSRLRRNVERYNCPSDAPEKWHSTNPREINISSHVKYFENHPNKISAVKFSN